MSVPCPQFSPESAPLILYRVDSVQGQGRISSNPTTHTVLPDGLKVPIGLPTEDADYRGSLIYNEYVEALLASCIAALTVLLVLLKTACSLALLSLFVCKIGAHLLAHSTPCSRSLHCRYIVYKETQAKAKYLLRVKFNYHHTSNKRSR